MGGGAIGYVDTGTGHALQPIIKSWAGVSSISLSIVTVSKVPNP